MRKGYGLKVLAVLVITLFGFQLSTSVVRADSSQFNVQQNAQPFTNYPSNQPTWARGTSGGAQISDDGSFYGITAFPPGPYPGSDPNDQSDYPHEAYIVDRTTGTPTFVAYTDDGRSFWDLGFQTDTVGISRDGRYVLYEATSGPDSGPYSSNTGADVPLLGGYVYDRQTQQSVRVTQQYTNPNFNISTFAISGDGRYIIYNINDNTGEHAYIHDRMTGNEHLLGNGNLGLFALSNDGRFVAYGNYDSTAGVNQVDLLDRQSGVVSVLASNVPSSSNVAVSDDGNIVAYDYIQNSIGHVVVINRSTGLTTNKSQGSFLPKLSGDGSTLVTGTLTQGPVKYSTPADGPETVLSQNSQTFPESINTNGSIFTTDSYNAATAQSWTNTVFVTKSTAPSAPTNLKALPPTHSAPLISWDAVSGATSYNIYRNGSLIDSISASNTSYTDYLAPSGTNSYYVTAVNSAGESGPSNTISVTYVAINSGGSAQGTYVADTDVSGGSTYSSSNSVDTGGVTNPAPEAVYQSVRYGNFTYTIPNLTANTNYTVRLHFNELYWNSAGSRVFNASINGNQVLHNFDIFKTAGGENKAVTEQFNATSDSNGNIAIAFSTVTDNAMVNGIELDSSTVPTHSLTGTVYNDTNRNGAQDTGESGYNGATVTLSDGQTTTTDSNGNYTFSNLPQEDTYTATVTPPNDYVATTTNPVRFALSADATDKNFGLAPFQSLSINAGGSSASSFVSDEDFSGGTPYSSSATVDTSGVTNPAPQSVYQTVRYGNTFSYTVPNLSASHNYTIRLHFNELYWNSAGSRVFNASINGSQVLNNYDIFQDAGGENIAVVKQFTETPDTNGNITITFTTVTDNAMVNGIEIVQQ